MAEEMFRKSPEAVAERFVCGELPERRIAELIQQELASLAGMGLPVVGEVTSYAPNNVTAGVVAMSVPPRDRESALEREVRSVVRRMAMESVHAVVRDHFFDARIGKGGLTVAEHGGEL